MSQPFLFTGWVEDSPLPQSHKTCQNGVGSGHKKNGQMPKLHTVQEVIDWYATHEIRKFSPVALKERRRVWGLFQQQAGDLLIEEASPANLLDFILSQDGAKSNHTRRRFKATINKPFNTAAEVGLIARNPFRGLKIPEGPSGRDWTKQEYQAILRGSAAYVRRLIILERFGGTRPGEARTVKWTEVRDDVDAIIQAEHKTAYCSKEPRRIHYNDVIIKLLTWLRRHRQGETFVFLNSKGRPWTIKALTKYFQSVRKRGGLPDDVKLHGGRHTFATNALMNGVDLVTLAQLLGHKTVKSTERYLHLVNKKAYLNAAMNKAIGKAAS